MVFEQFAEVLQLKPKKEKRSLLEIVRELTRFALSLPEYTRNTQSLSPSSVRVRQALFETREPDSFFNNYPKRAALNRSQTTKQKSSQ